MKIKASELIGPALDWAVAVSLGGTGLWYDTVGTWWFTLNGKDRALSSGWSESQNFNPSTNWAQGGPIIERECIHLWKDDCSRDWLAAPFGADDSDRDYDAGPTPLIAAMRCYCCAKLGDEIDIPQELQPCQQPNS